MPSLNLVTDIQPGEVVVTGGPTLDEQKIIVGIHHHAGDDPVSIGGTRTGPTPSDFLLAELGSSTSLTLRMYADRKQWPLEVVQVRLRHLKLPAKDCVDCETEEGSIDLIEKDIELAGPLTDEQRIRLMEIADLCPVHSSLIMEKRIQSRLVETST